jgi:hypothetical protein
MSTRYVTPATLAALLCLAALSGTAAEEPKPHDENKMHMESQESIDHQVEMAQSAADHEAVAKRFEDEATQFETLAGQHERLAERYRRGQGVGPKANATRLANHCESLVKSLRTSAAEAREMAQLHREVGKQMSQ